MKSLIILIIFLLSLPFVSAYYVSGPSSVKIGDNFNFVIHGTEVYAVEIEIPEHFTIVSDPSNGATTEGIYKTFTSGDLIIVLRGTQTGTYTITGRYTSGEGIKSLNSIDITIKSASIDGSGGGSGGSILSTCPSCPTNTKWSNCEEDKQVKITYKCSSITNYKCVQSIETRDCRLTRLNICDVDWVCKDSKHLAYQSSDCSLSSIQECSIGCESGECNVTEEMKIEFVEDKLGIEIVSAGETQQSIFTKVINFIKKLINLLIFWN